MLKEPFNNLNQHGNVNLKKTTPRFQLIKVRMINVNKTIDSAWWQGYKVWGISIHCW